MTGTPTRPATFLSPPGWRRRKTPVEAMEAQGRPWQWPAKQEPTEAPPERRGRNSRLHGGTEVTGVLLLLADGTQVPVTELPGRGPWTFLVLQPDPGFAGPEAGGAARALSRVGRAGGAGRRGGAGGGEGSGGRGFLGLGDARDQGRARAGFGRPVLVGLGELAPVA